MKIFFAGLLTAAGFGALIVYLVDRVLRNNGYRR